MFLLKSRDDHYHGMRKTIEERTLSIPIFAIVFWAWRPHAKTTTPGYFANGLCRTERIAWAVNVSQPFFAWDPAVWARTVKLVFSQSTPSFATGVRSLQ